MTDSPDFRLRMLFFLSVWAFAHWVAGDHGVLLSWNDLWLAIGVVAGNRFLNSVKVGHQ